ncbi:MAG: hypothetical protein ACYC7A_09195 [Thermoanaerobaculia bacterium]
MRSRIVAAVWVAGATVPLLGAAVFLVGCCVLPFHGLMHKLMPLCETAASIIAGGHGEHDHDAEPATPAREKEPVKPLLTVLTTASPIASVARVSATLAVTASAAPRSFMSLGAVRCDQDVGLHLLDVTFLI